MTRREFGERFEVRSVGDPGETFVFVELIEVLTMSDRRGRRPDQIRRSVAGYWVDDRDDLTGITYADGGLGVRADTGQEFRVERLA